jgi:hypothetical protein
MDNKMSLHIVWPFVILWIIVAAMVGGDLIPLHLVDSTGGVGKVVYMVDELTPVDDVDLSEQFESMEPVDQLNPTDPVADPVSDLTPIGEDILQDSIVSDPVDDVTSGDGIPQDSLGEITYILNTNSMKFHELDCHSAELIAPENFKESFDTRDTIIENGYVPCKNCNP